MCVWSGWGAFAAEAAITKISLPAGLGAQIVPIQRRRDTQIHTSTLGAMCGSTGADERDAFLRNPVATAVCSQDIKTSRVHRQKVSLCPAAVCLCTLPRALGLPMPPRAVLHTLPEYPSTGFGVVYLSHEQRWIFAPNWVRCTFLLLRCYYSVGPGRFPPTMRSPNTGYQSSYTSKFTNAAVFSPVPPPGAAPDAKSTAPGSGGLPPWKRRHRPRRAGVAELGVGGQVRANPRRPRPRAGGVPDGTGEALHPGGGGAVHGVVRPGKIKPRGPAGPRRCPAVFAAGEGPGVEGVVRGCKTGGGGRCVF